MLELYSRLWFNSISEVIWCSYLCNESSEPTTNNLHHFPFISSVISFCMIKNEKMYACWFEWLKMDGFLLYISYDEIDQTRESICTWRRYTKTYIVLQKEYEWFAFVKLSHLSVSNRLHKTFTTLTDMIVFVKIKFSTNAMCAQL